MTTERDQRTAFEKWISSPPFEFEVDRFPNDPSKHAWPNDYRINEVSLAWHAWQAALREYAHAEREPQSGDAAPNDAAGMSMLMQTDRTIGEALEDAAASADGEYEELIALVDSQLGDNEHGREAYFALVKIRDRIAALTREVAFYKNLAMSNLADAERAEAEAASLKERVEIAESMTANTLNDAFNERERHRAEAADLRKKLAGADEAIRSLVAERDGFVLVPREYGLVKKDFLASPDTPQKRGALPTVTLTFGVEDWDARDRAFNALSKAMLATVDKSLAEKP